MIVCMLFSNAFYAKVIDHWTELYWSPFVGPEARGEFALEISMLVEAIFQEFVCQQSCLWKPIHAFSNSHEHHSILVDLAVEFVLIDNFLR